MALRSIFPEPESVKEVIVVGFRCALSNLQLSSTDRGLFVDLQMVGIAHHRLYFEID